MKIHDYHAKRKKKISIFTGDPEQNLRSNNGEEGNIGIKINSEGKKVHVEYYIHI